MLGRFLTIGAALAATAGFTADADLVASFPMDVRSGQIQESVSGERFAVEGHFTPENVPGAVGNALRFDGYTSLVNARLGNIIPKGTKTMTVELWAAVPQYPVIEIDTDTKLKTPIVSCLDEEKKCGFGFFIGYDGKWQFRTYVGGWPVDVNIDTPLPPNRWNHIAAVVDCNNRQLTVYNNGQAVGQARCNGELEYTGGNFIMGHSPSDIFAGPFRLTAYNGLIDDINIWTDAKTPEELSAAAENPANLDIPASRFADQVLRPRFHGMPAAGWTNECHGMTYSNGRYHLFFQKNGDGPYMARLHWGHISSENLYDWREEPIAIAPGAPYDTKGCWSGCVFTDPAITGGKPAIIYTGVDYGRATIDGASPLDDNLIAWQKWSDNPIINGRPQGLSDDFRDPYFFRNGDNAYIIVGTSKNGIGATTLHRYTGSGWTNDGDIFYQGSSAPLDGTFWEMPNITDMGGGQWLFTTTPLGLNGGVKSIYRVGTIGSDGKFIPSSANFRNIELTAREGFGLLSPTIYRHDGKTIALGIVPDKLSSENNWNLGWAHCYSLPREWSLSDSGELVQRPFSGLTGLRGTKTFSTTDYTLSGALDLAPVSGREVEIDATFTIGNKPFGFEIFKNASASATVTYNPTASSLTFDFSRLNRLINDGGVYDGVYTCAMPEFLRRGTDLHINLFIDHSIIDVFINDRWATSIRVFPTDADATGVSAFCNGGDVTVKSLNAWVLSPGGNSGIEEADALPAGNAPVNVYTMQGLCLRQAVDTQTATEGLPSGLYIVGTRKVTVK